MTPAQARAVVVDDPAAPITLWVYEGAMGRPVVIDDARAVALAADLLNAVRRRAATVSKGTET
jgi:hypothetical protein